MYISPFLLLDIVIKPWYSGFINFTFKRTAVLKNERKRRGYLVGIVAFLVYIIFVMIWYLMLKRSIAEAMLLGLVIVCGTALVHLGTNVVEHGHGRGLRHVERTSIVHEDVDGMAQQSRLCLATGLAVKAA